MGAAGASDAARARRHARLTIAAILAAAAALLALHMWCIVDAVRYRRPWLWVGALLIVPLVSALAYLASRPKPPGLARTRPGEHPSELDLAHGHAREGRFDLAVSHYRAADPSGRDGYIGYRLAHALYRSGDPAAALATLDAMGPVPIQHDPEFVPLLRAEVLIALGRKAEAAAVYAGVMPRPPSLNVFGAYADLLIELARPDEAIAVLEILEERLKQGDNPPGNRIAEPLRRAMATLSRLRPNP